MIAKLWGPVQTTPRHEDFLGAEYGSNNTGEISAICEALKWLSNEHSTRNAAIYYDSKYAAKVTTGEYMANNNKLLVATARQLLQTVASNRTIRFEHVKGHNQDIGNDWADQLADLGANCNSTRINIPENERQVIQPIIITNTETEVQRRRPPIHVEPTIRIPTPAYGSGATRRSRFAFGNVSTQQARENTNLNIVHMQLETAAETPVQEDDFEDQFQWDEPPTMNDCA
jgi:ribonuclease HI